jgi:hypothetical protein
LPIPSATTFALPAAPPAPANFNATATSSSQIDLTWNSAPGATGYRLFRSVGDSLNYGLLAIVGSTPASYSDTGLNSNLIHYYKIRAIGAGGALSPASVTFITTKNNIPVISKLSATAIPYGLTTSFTVNATDSDGDVLSFATRNLPSFVSINNNGNNSISLVMNPAQTDMNVYNNVTVIVSDSYGGRDSTMFTLTVNNNFAPTVNPIANYILNENDY